MCAKRLKGLKPLKSDNIFEYLIENNITVATCESCTGGLLAAAFTDVPGISSVFLEGAVTYTNEAKERLGVKCETLEEFGAVSRQTAREMAQCIKERAKSDIGISTTGVAGPEPSEGKPVGLVYTAIASKNKTHVFELNLSGSRREIREETVKAVLRHLKNISETEKFHE
ncbi:MAG: nicotinamide-nucleotide amidohydrolase family protein [Clostridia bacterium]|nr:nicotinamide-nucleotide amidohydrolase family protein [Clostridia bacterium]